MILVLLIGGLALLASTPLWGSMRRIHPAHRARLLGAGLVTGFVLIESGLVLWATPALLDAMSLAELAAACRRMLGGLVPGGRVGGMAAAAVLVWTTTAALVGLGRVVRSQRRYRVEPTLARAERRETHELVVLPTIQPFAYAVGGRRPQIVLTRGVVDRFPAEYVEAIMAHEMAHVRNRHHRFLMLSSGVLAAFGWIPPVRSGVDHLHLALERWADEEAAATVPDGRSSVRGAVLAMAVSMAAAVGVTGFGGPETIAERAKALAGGAPRRSPVTVTGLYAGLGALVVLAWASVGWATHPVAVAVINFGRCCHL